MQCWDLNPPVLVSTGSGVRIPDLEWLLPIVLLSCSDYFYLWKLSVDRNLSLVRPSIFWPEYPLVSLSLILLWEKFKQRSTKPVPNTMKENPIVNQKNLASSFFSIDIIQTILALLSAKHTAQWLHRECNCSFNIHLIDNDLDQLYQQSSFKLKTLQVSLSYLFQFTCFCSNAFISTRKIRNHTLTGYIDVGGGCWSRHRN